MAAAEFDDKGPAGQGATMTAGRTMAGRDGWSAELDDKAPAGQGATAGQDATVRTQATRQLMAAALQGDNQPLDWRLGRAMACSK